MTFWTGRIPSSLLRGSVHLASGFPGPSQDFQVHVRISRYTSGFPGPRQDFQVHVRISRVSRSTSGFPRFPGSRQDFQVHFTAWGCLGDFGHVPSARAACPVGAAPWGAEDLGADPFQLYLSLHVIGGELLNAVNCLER